MVSASWGSAATTLVSWENSDLEEAQSIAHGSLRTPRGQPSGSGRSPSQRRALRALNGTQCLLRSITTILSSREDLEKRRHTLYFEHGEAVKEEVRTRVLNALVKNEDLYMDLLQDLVNHTLRLVTAGREVEQAFCRTRAAPPAPKASKAAHSDEEEACSCDASPMGSQEQPSVGPWNPKDRLHSVLSRALKLTEMALQGLQGLEAVQEQWQGVEQHRCALYAEHDASLHTKGQQHAIQRLLENEHCQEQLAVEKQIVESRLASLGEELSRALQHLAGGLWDSLQLRGAEEAAAKRRAAAEAELSRVCRARGSCKGGAIRTSRRGAQRALNLTLGAQRLEAMVHATALQTRRALANAWPAPEM